MATRTVDGPDGVWLSARETAAFLGLGLTLFKSLLASGEFPPGVSFGTRAIRWHWLTPVAWAHLRSRQGAPEVSNHGRGKS